MFHFHGRTKNEAEASRHKLPWWSPGFTCLLCKCNIQRFSLADDLCCMSHSFPPVTPELLSVSTQHPCNDWKLLQQMNCSKVKIKMSSDFSWSFHEGRSVYLFLSLPEEKCVNLYRLGLLYILEKLKFGKGIFCTMLFQCSMTWVPPVRSRISYSSTAHGCFSLTVYQLRSSVLDIQGAFSLLNALRCIRPGEKHTLVLAFSPSLEKKVG